MKLVHGLRNVGEPRKIGASATKVDILDQDASFNITRASGTTVPTDGDAGYAVGCIFVKTGGSDIATIYVNVGTTTSCDFNVVPASTRVVDATSSSLTVTQAAHDGAVVTLNRAAGIAVTLPAATGSGMRLRFVVGTTFTGAGTIKVVGNDIMKGTAVLFADSGDTVVGFATAADSDTITFAADNSTGGVAGAEVELVDIAADTWFIRMVSDAAATEATPFSATVT